MNQNDKKKLIDIAIFGAGGFAKEVSGIIRDINLIDYRYNLIAYVVDDVYYKENIKIHNVDVVRRDWLLKNKNTVKCVCGVGYPKERKKISESLISQGVELITLIHPSAKIEDGTTVGVGCIFQHNSAVSYDCKIGDGVFLSDYVTVGHDSEIENYVTCFPKSQISGNVKIGSETIIGSLSFINERIKIADNVTVAPGSIVFRNIQSNVHVMGNPARKVEL